MKALVLAGGLGTRLRPLSCTRPKMLFPIGEQSLMDWTLKNLSQGGIDTVVMAVNYMAEALVRYLGPTKYDLGIIYSRENRPLGTGGPIRKAKDLLNSEPFLVMNGDVITDIDIRRLIDFHKAKRGLATVALTPVSDPTRYGAVELDWEGRITRFVEKPERGKEPSNLINAGIYVLDPKILDYIPDGRAVSIEREVFPVLANERKLFGFEFHGLWTDIGIPDDYLRANQIILSKYEGVKLGEGAKVDPSAKILPPCYIGSEAEIGADSLIGPNTTISDHVLIGKGCRIENSILFAGAAIGDYSSVKNAIIGEQAILERWVKVESGSLVGDYSMIRDSVTITDGVSICPSKEVTDSILERRQVM
ncbi:MAG: NDP-sugar synthase [Candidatus Bathyarchaeota archaeon]|nr:NDP-sugar synthase [Candidatus Bathyarchaeota archaeon]